MRIFGSKCTFKSVALLVMLFMLLAFTPVVIAQSFNPAAVGSLGGTDKYGNEFQPYNTESFQTGAWSYLSSCLAPIPETVTISIASPAVITGPNYCAAGQEVVFYTSGALPTGLTAGTTYFVISTGLSNTSFEVSTTLGGAAVNTSGSQSGIQTAIYSNATTSYTAAIQLPPVPPGLTVPGHCTLYWQSSNTSGTLTLGAQPNNTTSSLQVLNTAHTGANGATLADLSTLITSATTPTAISSTMTAGTANTTYRDDIDIMLATSPTATSPTLLSIYALSSSTSYTISLQPGSVCVWGF